MPRQNRVDPFSRIHATPARGLLMGNRGVLHDGEGPSLRKQSWSCDLWIICALEFKGERLPLMSPGFNTQLFFLDEPTALAAGHRPCFRCRRAAAKRFAQCAAEGVGENAALSAADLNRRLGEEMKPRLRVYGAIEPEACDPRGLPDFAMVAVGPRTFMKLRDAGLPWSFEGYGAPEPLPREALRLTPRVSLAALERGFTPVIHPSAGA